MWSSGWSAVGAAVSTPIVSSFCGLWWLLELAAAVLACCGGCDGCGVVCVDAVAVVAVVGVLVAMDVLLWVVLPGLPIGFCAGGKPGDCQVAVASKSLAVSVRPGCSMIVDRLSVRHESRSVQWVCVRSSAVNASAVRRPRPVVLASACATITHTGCLAVIAYVSMMLIWPSPNAVDAVGSIVQVASVVHVVVFVGMASGIVDMVLCSSFHVAPVFVGSHPVYVLSLVVRRSSVPRLRFDS